MPRVRAVERTAERRAKIAAAPASEPAAVPGLLVARLEWSLLKPAFGFSKFTLALGTPIALRREI